MTEASVKWDGDVLDRKPIGDFLYKLTMQRFSAYHSLPGQGALCVAIDAGWGAGKSFFVRHWSQDIVGLQHPVVHFDAWANDLSDDPLIGFMAQLKAALDPFIKQLPVAARVRGAAKRKLQGVLKQAPKAVLPAVTVLGKGILRRFAGVEADDLVDAVSDLSLGDIEKDASKALEKFFSSALQAHTDKQSAITALKASIEELLEYLENHSGTRLPMFVFIDELDRCRPDFAIKLLEGVKHLFDAHGVCFVFSTNLSQLSESAKAVYGNGFDGYKYLKRFFAFEYFLPEPSGRAFAAQLVSQSVLKSGRLIPMSALPTSAQGGGTPDAALAADFDFVSQAFRLDLRSQKQVFRLAEAASAGIPDGKNLYCLYLFFLAATYHEGPAEFRALGRDGAGLNELLNRLFPASCQYERYDDRESAMRKASVSIKELVGIYSQLANKTVVSLSESLNRTNQNEYPASLRWVVSKEFSGRHIARDAVTPLHGYYDLVLRAGQVTHAQGTDRG